MHTVARLSLATYYNPASMQFSYLTFIAISRFLVISCYFAACCCSFAVKIDMECGHTQAKVTNQLEAFNDLTCPTKHSRKKALHVS